MNMSGAMAEGSPALSVVMPVRNGAAYLEPAVQSVLDQTFADFEFIIIDDGSTDETPALLAILAGQDARIRTLRTSGEGIVAALKLGFRTARGELIARMDADDIALPNRFAVQIEVLRKSPQFVGIGGSAIIIDMHGNETGWMKVPTDAHAAMAELLRRNSFLHPTMMLRRDAVIAAGLFRPACIYAEDYDLWLRLAERGEMANLDEPMIRLRLHALQTSKTRRLTQRAATAFARQLALRRRSGHPEGMDMTLPLHTALKFFLQQWSEGQGTSERSERKDIEIILREVHHELDAAMVKKIIRLLRSGGTLKGIVLLRLKLALTKKRPPGRA